LVVILWVLEEILIRIEQAIIFGTLRPLFL
jgi:hypothetical protein